jgi:glycosyltransferase involved in cell wall biosynthesis
MAARLGLAAESSGDRWVLFVGRLHPVKDPGLALETFAELLRTTARAARLIVCGGGAERAALERLAADLGIADRTHFLGDQPRAVVAELMSAADVLIVTSKAEGGGPRVVLEALGSGLPVVSTVVGEVRRSITTGLSGWLVESRRPDDLAEGLRWALDQPRDAVQAQALEASRPFEVSAVLGRLYEIYRELASTTRSRPSRFAR